VTAAVVVVLRITTVATVVEVVKTFCSFAHVKTLKIRFSLSFTFVSHTSPLFARSFCNLLDAAPFSWGSATCGSPSWRHYNQIQNIQPWPPY
jgi:hypothetical protein